MKKCIREKMLSLRIAQEKSEAIKKSHTICKKVIESIEYKNAKTVMAYFPIKGEVFTDEIVLHALSHGKKLLAPKVSGDSMYAVMFDEKTQRNAGKFGVPEPCGEEYKGEFDLVIVPGLAFDKEFYRLGFGKGYYDKFLKDKKCIKMGIGYDFQIVESLPFDKHDIPMDILIYG